MPANHCLRAHDGGRLQHTRPQAVEPDEEEPIAICRARAFGSGAAEDVEPMSEDDIPGLDTVSRLDK